MDNKVKELQAELDNVAAVLRSYAAENLKIYKEAKEELGEDSRLAIAKKAALDEITNIMEELGVEWHLPNFYFTFGTAEQYPYTIGQYSGVRVSEVTIQNDKTINRWEPVHILEHSENRAKEQ